MDAQNSAGKQKFVLAIPKMEYIWKFYEGIVERPGAQKEFGVSFVENRQVDPRRKSGIKVELRLSPFRRFFGTDGKTLCIVHKTEGSQAIDTGRFRAYNTPTLRKRNSHPSTDDINGMENARPCSLGFLRFIYISSLDRPYGRSLPPAAPAPAG